MKFEWTTRPESFDRRNPCVPVKSETRLGKGRRVREEMRRSYTREEREKGKPKPPEIASLPASYAARPSCMRL